MNVAPFTALAVGVMISCLNAFAAEGPAESPPGPIKQEPTETSQGVIFSNISIERHGIDAVVSFATNWPVSAGIEYAPGRITVAEPVPGTPPVPHPPAGGLVLPPVRPPSGTLSGFTGLVSPLETNHTIRLNNLKSNTPYWFRIWAQDETGALAQSYPVGFETLKRRLKITFEEAHIFDTGDFIGDGEPTWFFSAVWANPNSSVPPSYSVKSCFPYSADPPDAQVYARAFCVSGDTGQASTITDPDGGRVLPLYTPTHLALSYVFAEENFAGGLPKSIGICGSATEDDSGFGLFDTLLHEVASIGVEFDMSGSGSGGGCGGVLWNVLTPTAQHQRITADAREGGFSSVVIVRLEDFYDDLTYVGYTDGGFVVSTFPVASNVHIGRPPR